MTTKKWEGSTSTCGLEMSWRHYVDDNRDPCGPGPEDRVVIFKVLVEDVEEASDQYDHLDWTGVQDGQELIACGLFVALAEDEGLLHACSLDARAYEER